MELPLLEREELLRELDASADGDYIATDADGTLWSGDVGEDFFAAVLEQGDFRDGAIAEYRSLATKYGLATSGGGRELASSLFRAYEDGRFPESECCAAIAASTTDWTDAEVRAFTDRIAARADLRKRVHLELADVLRIANARGIPIIVVSASPIAIVRSALAAIELPVDAVLAVDPLFDGDKQTARVRQPMPYDEGKAAALRELLPGRRALLAFGDNAFDVPMLKYARLGVAVRPKARLLARAQEVAGLRVLSRGA